MKTVGLTTSLAVCTLSLVLSVFVGCQPATIEQADDAAAATSPATDTATLAVAECATLAWEGQVNKEDLAVFWVIQEDSTLRGHCVRAGEFLPLQGHLKADGRWKATARDESLEEVALLTGTHFPDGMAQGYWQPLRAGARPESFDLAPQATPAALDLDEWATYQAQFGQYVQTLDLSKSPIGQALDFSVRIASPFCTGDIQGQKAYSWQGAWYYYGDEGCVLRIQPTDAGFQVTEWACDFYHGVRCSFEGLYLPEPSVAADPPM